MTNLLIKQNEHLNALKGLAILIVVAEHSFMNYIPNFDSNYIFKYTVSFNMALFMFISGYLTFGKTINIRKKFLTLVIPFVLWNQIGYLMNVITSYVSHNNPISYFEYVKRWIISPDWGLWFLWALFLIFVYFKLVDHFTNHDVKYGDIVAIIVAHVLIQIVPTGYFGIGFLKWFFIFFSTGYLYPKYVSKIPYKKLLKFIIPIMFLVLTYFWNRMSPPTIWESFVSIFANKPIPGLHHLLTIYQILVPMFGLLTAYILVPKRGGHIFRLFSFLGKKSLIIYALHFYFPQGISTGYLLVATSTIFGVVSSLALGDILEKSKTLSALLFGSRG